MSESLLGCAGCEAARPGTERKIAVGKRPENHGTIECIDGKIPEGIVQGVTVVDFHCLFELAQGTPCFCSSSSTVAVNAIIQPSGEAAFHGKPVIFRGHCTENGHQVELDFNSKSSNGWQLYSEAEEELEDDDDDDWEDIDSGEEDAEASAMHTKYHKSILALGLDGFVQEFDVPDGLFLEVHSSFCFEA